MTFFSQIKLAVPVTDYKVPEKCNPSGWRARFKEVETWAAGNPWDNSMPDQKELKLCISELFQGLHMAHDGFKFCAEKNGSIEALTAANSIATILES